MCNRDRVLGALSERDPVNSKGMSWSEWEAHMFTLIESCSGLIDENKAMISKLGDSSPESMSAMIYDLSSLAFSENHIKRPSFLFISLAGSSNNKTQSIEELTLRRNQNTTTILNALEEMKKGREAFKTKYLERISETDDLVQTLFSNRSNASFNASSLKWKYCDRAWYRVLQRLTNERGPWGTGGQREEGVEVQRFWKLDRREDQYRRHLKLKVNMRGNDYMEACPLSDKEMAKSKRVTNLSNSAVLASLKLQRIENEGQLLLDLKAASALGKGLGVNKVDLGVADEEDMGNSPTDVSESFPSPFKKRKSFLKKVGNETTTVMDFALLKKSFDCEIITPMMQTKGKLEVYAGCIVFKRDPVYDEKVEDAGLDRRKKKQGVDTSDLLKRPSTKTWDMNEVCMCVCILT